VARAASAEAAISNDLSDVMRESVAEGRLSVSRTRDQMPTLRQANVVDAGGMGLLSILEAMYLTYVGEELPSSEEPVVRSFPIETAEQQSYGYCTEFLIRGRSLDLAVLRDGIGTLGDSLLVVGDPELIRVHVHTLQPGRAIDFALAHGAVEQIKIDNMQEQHDRLRGLPHTGSAEPMTSGLVVVSTGDGFASIFKSFGATIIPGGQTFNPSTQDIVGGIRRTHAREYVLLPNNRNVVLSAKQASSVAEQPVAVVLTRNLAEGVAAALAFQPNLKAEENAAAMSRVVADIRTGLVTQAVRATTVDDQVVKAGDFLGLVDDRIVCVGSDPCDLSLLVLQSLGAAEAEVVTLYAGQDAADAEAESLRSRVAAEFLSQQVDLVHGGQPLYRYILACE
jgi:DAK2 domain fusion protein YloV